MKKIHLRKRYFKRKNIRKKIFKIKKHKIIKKKDKFIIIMILIFICVTLLLSFISKKATPILMNYAEKRAKSVATIMITEAVNNNVFKDMNKEDIFIYKKDDNGNIISTELNPVTINTVLNKITIYVQNYLEQLESGKIDGLELSSTILNSYDLEKMKKGVIYEIPSGIIFNNAILSNLGPKIPVKINLNGDVVTDIKTDVSEYGINNALIKVTANVKVYMQVIIPFKTKEIVVESDIPIVMKLVQGEVPSYYYPGVTNN